MDTIHLHEPSLVAEVVRVAKQEGEDAEHVVAKAVRQYLAHYRQKRILAETEAWYRLPTETRNQYRGQYVAVHNGEVVDSDIDRLTLYERISKQYGRRSILIIEGGDKPMPVYRVRSPRSA